MEIIYLGLSHKTAPVEIRERFAVPDGQLAGEATLVRSIPHVEEVVLVSTCNRVEFYAATNNPQAALESLRAFVEKKSPDAHTAFHPQIGSESVRHLFRVVSGLESMVIGETEILGQVKKAYQAAHTAGVTSRHLNKMFQRAFNVAKEVRTDTNITRGAVSVGSVAVELAQKIFGKLDHCKVMILGAGETAEMTAKALLSRGAKSIFVSNRTFERAATLAESMGGRAIHFDQWEKEFQDLDILIGSTGAPHAIVTKDKLLPMMRHRPDRPLFCIDLAVPRDFEPTTNDLDGVYLYDVDALQEIAADGLAVRKQELKLCEEIIEHHVADFEKWLITSARHDRLQNTNSLSEKPLHAR